MERLGSEGKTKCNTCESYQVSYFMLLYGIVFPVIIYNVYFVLLQEATKQLSMKKLPIVVCFHLKVC